MSRQECVEQYSAGRLNTHPLANQIAWLAHWVLGQREVGVRVLLHCHREATNRDALRDRQHDRRTRCRLANQVAPRGDDGHTVDVGSPGTNPESETLLVEEPQVRRRHLAELIDPQQPAELHLDDSASVRRRS